MTRRGKRNLVAFVLALLGGLIFIAIGWTGQKGIGRLVGLLRGVVGPLPFIPLLAFGMLSVAALGGVVIILGGIAFVDDQIWGGRILIYFGAGGGLITLIAFAWLLATETSTVTAQEGFIPGLIGFTLTVAARIAAKTA